MQLHRAIFLVGVLRTLHGAESIDVSVGLSPGDRGRRGAGGTRRTPEDRSARCRFIHLVFRVKDHHQCMIADSHSEPVSRWKRGWQQLRFGLLPVPRTLMALEAESKLEEGVG